MNMNNYKMKLLPLVAILGFLIVCVDAATYEIFPKVLEDSNRVVRSTRRDRYGHRRFPDQNIDIPLEGLTSAKSNANANSQSQGTGIHAAATIISGANSGGTASGPGFTKSESTANSESFSKNGISGSSSSSSSSSSSASFAGNPYQTVFGDFGGLAKADAEAQATAIA